MIIVSFSNEQVVFDMNDGDLIILNHDYNGFNQYIHRIIEDQDVQKLVETYHDIVKRSYRGSDFAEFSNSENYDDLMNAMFTNPGDVAQYFMEGVLYSPKTENDPPHMELFIGGDLT